MVLSKIPGGDQLQRVLPRQVESTAIHPAIAFVPPEGLPTARKEERVRVQPELSPRPEISTEQTVEAAIETPLKVGPINLVISDLHAKVDRFQAGCISQALAQWRYITNDVEILQTVHGLHANLPENVFVLDFPSYI